VGVPALHQRRIGVMLRFGLGNGHPFRTFPYAKVIAASSLEKPPTFRCVLDALRRQADNTVYGATQFAEGHFGRAV
jgi:hypothetical protein